MRPNVLFIITSRETNYFRRMSTILSRTCGKVIVGKNSPSTAAAVGMQLAATKTELVATTDFRVFKLFCAYLEGTANDNEGTVLAWTNPINKKPCRILLLPPVKNIFTNEGPFLFTHFLSKLTRPLPVAKGKLNWSILQPEELDSVWAQMQNAQLCAVDIETTKTNLAITSVSYTYDYGNSTITKVIPCNNTTYPFCISAMRRLNSTKVAKIMQNGRYDATYFLRFNAPLRNYRYDIYHLQHCLFPELPKTLHFISSMYLDNYIYWKEEVNVNLYLYNAKDTHNTYYAFLGMLAYIHTMSCDYAITNYGIEFPVVFPCISCGLEGLIVDEKEMNANYEKAMGIAEEKRAWINKMIGTQNFNPGSPKQVKELQQCLGAKEFGSDIKVMRRWKEKQPIVSALVEAIQEYKKKIKAAGTYFQLELLDGRLMYALDPAGTDSGRLASKASHFWCGTQIQNIPQYGRSMVKAEEGWEFVAVDKAQSESWCTGFISEDPELIKAVTTSPDFHCHNASMFFGIPFNELWDVELNKVIRKDIRTLSKRTNHGANYNMGPAVLLETMGLQAVLEAAALLQLPKAWTPLMTCKYLLYCFDRSYKIVRGKWYKDIIQEVVRTGKLVLPGIPWTRRTFLRPHENKPDLNSAVAHKPQSLSVMLVNRAFVKVWRLLQLGKYYGKMRIKAQVHDEILSIVRDGYVEDAAQDIADMMTIPIEINGRVMAIPSTIARGKKWSDAK